MVGFPCRFAVVDRVAVRGCSCRRSIRGGDGAGRGGIQHVTLLCELRYDGQCFALRYDWLLLIVSVAFVHRSNQSKHNNTRYLAIFGNNDPTKVAE